MGCLNSKNIAGGNAPFSETESIYVTVILHKKF